MKAETIIFICHLAHKFPQLKEVMEEYIDSYGGEILPHLLISEYVNFIIDKDIPETWIKDFLAYLESNFDAEKDDDISNLIAVSFIENLPFDKAKKHWSIDMLGDNMQDYYYKVLSE